MEGLGPAFGLILDAVRISRKDRTMQYSRSQSAALVRAMCILSLASAVASAQPWVSFDNKTRYLAMGDSLSAGYGAMPATHGFTYRLYETGTIDKAQDTLLCVMAVPDSFSLDVLTYQVPQVPRFFKNTGADYKKVITLTVGGNDMFAVLRGVPPETVLGTLFNNLAAILGTLHGQFPDARIFVGNVYDPMLPIPDENALVVALNQTIAGAVAYTNSHALSPFATLVDVYTAFQGRSGLLLSERNKADFGQIHPTNAGYEVMLKTFAAAISASH